MAFADAKTAGSVKGGMVGGDGRMQAAGVETPRFAAEEEPRASIVALPS
ncbi:hypothetical protein [Actinoplanes sp. CA-252034]